MNCICKLKITSCFNFAIFHAIFHVFFNAINFLFTNKFFSHFIIRGRWHGEVMIYTFSEYKDEKEFREEVGVLSRLRHENLQLFMGAVMEPIPCIVTSMKKGLSLYEHIHDRKESLSIQTRISIARQVAQVVGYLHAKNIKLHKRLNSHNITLENKVKLCLIDQRVCCRCACSSCACSSCYKTPTQSISRMSLCQRFHEFCRFLMTEHNDNHALKYF